MKNVQLEVADQIATVTIDRPKALNALNTETLSELKECFSELEKQKDVRVVILTGGGNKSFVATSPRWSTPRRRRAGPCHCWPWRRSTSWRICPR